MKDLIKAQKFWKEFNDRVKTIEVVSEKKKYKLMDAYFDPINELLVIAIK